MTFEQWFATQWVWNECQRHGVNTPRIKYIRSNPPRPFSFWKTLLVYSLWMFLVIVIFWQYLWWNT